MISGYQRIIIQLAYHSSGILVSVSLEDIYVSQGKRGNGFSDERSIIHTHLRINIARSLNHTLTQSYIYSYLYQIDDDDDDDDDIEYEYDEVDRDGDEYDYDENDIGTVDEYDDVV